MTRMGLGKLSQENRVCGLENRSSEREVTLRLESDNGVSDNPQLCRRISQFPPGLNGFGQEVNMETKETISSMLFCNQVHQYFVFQIT